MEKYSDADILGLTRELDRLEQKHLAPIAERSVQAERRRADRTQTSDYRQPFSVDADRILHSMAYARYIDKTQVFSLVRNDHITHRVLHVQLLSKIARTIGRFLRFNEDLIEAIALGHDIGHAPFGHEGERYLSALCRHHGIGHFVHSVQSVQFLDRVERKGRGWNLCRQTLDGILCHDGEIHDVCLKASKPKSFEMLDREGVAKIKAPGTAMIPETMEGCVVRLADTISYIGRDFEDAIRLKIIQRSQLPQTVTDVLGNTNGTIVYRLVTDLIATSRDQSGTLAYSPAVAEALGQMKRFNYQFIYTDLRIKSHSRQVREIYHCLFERYMDDLRRGNERSPIFAGFLDQMDDQYVQVHCDAEMIRDFIAGMTDRFFLDQAPPQLRPQTWGPVVAKPLAAGKS